MENWGKRLKNKNLSEEPFWKLEKEKKETEEKKDKETKRQRSASRWYGTMMAEEKNFNLDEDVRDRAEKGDLREVKKQEIPKFKKEDHEILLNAVKAASENWLKIKEAKMDDLIKKAVKSEEQDNVRGGLATAASLIGLSGAFYIQAAQKFSEMAEKGVKISGIPAQETLANLTGYVPVGLLIASGAAMAYALFKASHLGTKLRFFFEERRLKCSRGEAENVKK